MSALAFGNSAVTGCLDKARGEDSCPATMDDLPTLFFEKTMTDPLFTIALCSKSTSKISLPLSSALINTLAQAT